MAKSKHLVLDCDPGCDDALAIAYLLSHGDEGEKYESIDFLTATGNVSVDQTTTNVSRILAACNVVKNREETAAKESLLKLYRGCSRNMMGDRPSAASVHGRDGLGDAPNSMIGEEFNCEPINWIQPDEDENAITRLVHLTRSKEVQNFDLLCIGPLTNLATALSLMGPKEQEEFLGKCKRVVVMGGSFDTSGNISHSSEFNMFADPVSVQIVLDIVKQYYGEDPILHFVPLNATEQVAIPLDNMDELKGGNAEINKVVFLRYILNQYGKFHVYSGATRPDIFDDVYEFCRLDYIRSMLTGSSGDSELKKFCYLHDPLAAWVLVNIEKYGGWGAENKGGLWKTESIRVDVGKGESRGRVITCRRLDGEPAPVSIPSVGTAVKWLNLERGLGANLREAFLKDMCALLQINNQYQTNQHASKNA